MDIEDHVFDQQLPEHLQSKSRMYFAPVAIARLAARLLAPQPGMSVLDVGAGVGKFCITAALEVKHATFVGVECRPELVELANEIAGRHTLTNTRFVHGDALDLDWGAYDAFFLFNPFSEQLFDGVIALDRTIQFSRPRFFELVRAVEDRLAQARIGTRVVCFHGFGGTPPKGYELTDQALYGIKSIELWIKTRAMSAAT